MTIGERDCDQCHERIEEDDEAWTVARLYSTPNPPMQTEPPNSFCSKECLKAYVKTL